MKFKELSILSVFTVTSFSKIYIISLKTVIFFYLKFKTHNILLKQTPNPPLKTNQSLRTLKDQSLRTLKTISSKNIFL